MNYKSCKKGKSNGFLILRWKIKVGLGFNIGEDGCDIK